MERNIYWPSQASARWVGSCTGSTDLAGTETAYYVTDVNVAVVLDVVKVGHETVTVVERALTATLPSWML